MNEIRFRRSRNKKIFGVCGGLAEYFNRNATIIRIAWVVISLFMALIPGIIIYLLLAVLMENPE